jgi:hypothetical protein
VRMTVRHFCENQGAKIEESTRQYERERERERKRAETLRVRDNELKVESNKESTR